MYSTGTFVPQKEKYSTMYHFLTIISLFKVNSYVLKCIQMYPDVSRRIQMYPDVSRCVQMYPNVSNWSRNRKICIQSFSQFFFSEKVFGKVKKAWENMHFRPYFFQPDSLPKGLYLPSVGLHTSKREGSAFPFSRVAHSTMCVCRRFSFYSALPLLRLLPPQQ